MDAVDFLKALKRRSASRPDYYGEELSIADINPESLAAQVETWAKENPVKTRQDVFLEQWPEAFVTDNGDLAVCPRSVSANHRNGAGGCATIERPCNVCRREFWSQEVE